MSIHAPFEAKDKAREGFAKAVAWLEGGQKDNPELRRFRAEAAELLGLEEDLK